MEARLHTAEHILYTLLNQQFKVETKALEFKETSCRAVYNSDTDLRKYKQELEQKTNEIIDKNYEVTNYLLSRKQAKQDIDLSLVPESNQKISIYEIIGFNKLACIGPHVKNTKEIGIFQIQKIKKKGQNSYSINFIIIK